MLVKVVKLKLNKLKAEILMSFLEFSMKTSINFFILSFSSTQFEWNNADDSFDDAIESSLPKKHGKKIPKTIGTMKKIIFSNVEISLT